MRREEQEKTRGTNEEVGTETSTNQQEVTYTMTDTTNSMSNILTFVKERKAISIAIGIVALLLLASFFVIPRVQASIRSQQTETLVMKKYTDVKKVKSLSPEQLKKDIVAKKTFSVAFVNPRSTHYDIFEKSLLNKDKMAQLNAAIIVFPLVYKLKETQKEYKLTSDMTLVYFENGKEANRLDLAAENEIELYFVDYLNNLTISKEALQAQEEAKKAHEAALKQQESSKEEEVIDGLE